MIEVPSSAPQPTVGDMPQGTAFDTQAGGVPHIRTSSASAVGSACRLTDGLLADLPLTDPVVPAPSATFTMWPAP